MTSKKLTVAEVADLIAEVEQPALRLLLTDVYARLNAQARTVRNIRDSDAPARKSSGTVSGNPAASGFPSDTPGVFVPTRKCLACGNDKEVGRILILCKRCASEKNRALQYGDTIPRYTCCGNCGKALNGTTTPLCGKCALSYRKWRDNQKG